MASTSKAATDPGSTTSQEEVITTIIEDIVIVKCGLRSVIALKDKEYAILSATIEQHVELVSKMMRRASLVLLHHLLTLAASGGWAKPSRGLRPRHPHSEPLRYEHHILEEPAQAGRRERLRSVGLIPSVHPGNDQRRRPRPDDLPGAVRPGRQLRGHDVRHGRQDQRLGVAAKGRGRESGHHSSRD